MLSSLDYTNYSALLYNNVKADIIAKICEPLFTNFGITVFIYSHFFNNGTYLDLCTNKKWQEHYMECFAAENFVKSYIKKIHKQGTRYVLWNNDIGLDREKTANKFIIDSCGFDIWHGFSIYKHHADSIEAWHFGTTKDNHKIVNFYINHLELLEHFICYFKDKASSLIDTNDLRKMIVMKDRTPLSDMNSSFSEKKSIMEYINQTRVTRYSVNTLQGIVYISRREAECIVHLSSSRTVKEIACLMKISPRTVESYLENAKRKLGCWTRSQLVDSFSLSAKMILLRP